MTTNRESAVRDGLLTPEQVADYLAVAPKTVKDWLRAKPPKLQGVKLAGKLWRIRRADLDRFMDGRLDPTEHRPGSWRAERLDLDLPADTSGLGRGDWGGLFRLVDGNGTEFGIAPYQWDIDGGRVRIVGISWDPDLATISEATDALQRAIAGEKRITR